jgi:transposase
VLALLDERRDNTVAQRTRLVNQLHALLRDLIPGGAPTHLSAATAARLLTGVRPIGPVETARKQLARDLVRWLGGVRRGSRQQCRPDSTRQDQPASHLSSLLVR